MRSLVLVVVVLVIQGCATSGYKQFYSQSAPTKYPTTERVLVFEYPNVDVKEIHELLFSDYLIIGKSAFNGPYESPSNSAYFAESIGADILITSSQFKEMRTSFINFSTPATSTTYLSGSGGGGFFSGTATTYGTRTTTVPVHVDRYNQTGLFLKNVNNVVPLWERTEDQYKRTEDSSFDGMWSNENYKLNVFKSGDQIVAFIREAGKDRSDWEMGQLKFFFGQDSNVGIYLMGNKTPMPSTFNLNKFGHIEVKLIGLDKSVSFAK